MRAIPNLPWTALLPTLKVSGKPGQHQCELSGGTIAGSSWGTAMFHVKHRSCLAASIELNGKSLTRVLPSWRSMDSRVYGPAPLGDEVGPRRSAKHCGRPLLGIARADWVYRAPHPR